MRPPRKGDWVLRVIGIEIGGIYRVQYEAGYITDLSDGGLRVKVTHAGGEKVDGKFYDTYAHLWDGQWRHDHDDKPGRRTGDVKHKDGCAACEVWLDATEHAGGRKP